MVDLQFNDVLDVILEYHNAQAWEAVNGDIEEVTSHRLRAFAAREILDEIERTIERQEDRDEFNAAVQRKYEAFRGTLYFNAKQGYRETGE